VGHMTLTGKVKNVIRAFVGSLEGSWLRGFLLIYRSLTRMPYNCYLVLSFIVSILDIVFL
jgi:hypothetical protein